MSAHPPAGQPTRREPTAAEWREMQNNPEFLDLKKTFRSFTFPMSIAFFVWYVFYVVLATYQPELMGKDMFLGMNLGIFLGILQFVTTFIITAVYIKYANKNIEPKATRIREIMEG